MKVASWKAPVPIMRQTLRRSRVAEPLVWRSPPSSPPRHYCHHCSHDYDYSYDYFLRGYYNGG